jgi:hypothetical protein
MARTEDDEFNARLKKAGGHIYLVPDVQIIYYARDTVSKLLRMLFQYGYFKPLVAIKHGRPTSMRQLAPLGFLLSLVLLSIGSMFFPACSLMLAGLVALHLGVGSLASIRLAEEHGVRSASLAPVVFLLMHLAYGTGYFLGLVNAVARGAHSGQNGRDVAITR